jgi:hypothetical protein
VISFAVRSSVEAIDYPNFKDRVSRVRGREWHEMLLSVWTTMRRVDPGGWGGPRNGTLDRPPVDHETEPWTPRHGGDMGEERSAP